MPLFNNRSSQNIPLPIVVKTAVSYINVVLKPFDRKLVVFLSKR